MEGPPCCFLKWPYQYIFPPTVLKGCAYSTSSPIFSHFFLFCWLVFILTGRRWDWLEFLMLRNGEHLCMLVGHLCIYIRECLSKLLVLCCDYLLLLICRVLYIIYYILYNLLLYMWFVNIFSYFMNWLLTFLILLFADFTVLKKRNVKLKIEKCHLLVLKCIC